LKQHESILAYAHPIRQRVSVFRELFSGDGTPLDGSLSIGDRHFFSALSDLGIGDYLLVASVGTLERKAQTVSIKSLSCTSITVSDVRSTRYRVYGRQRRGNCFKEASVTVFLPSTTVILSLSLFPSNAVVVALPPQVSSSELESVSVAAKDLSTSQLIRRNLLTTYNAIFHRSRPDFL